MMIMSPKSIREQTHLPQSFLLIPEHIKVKYVRRPDPVAQSCRALQPEKCRRISAWEQPSLCHDRGVSASPAGTGHWMHLPFSRNCRWWRLCCEWVRSQPDIFFSILWKFIQQTDKRQACIKALSLYHNAALGLHQTLSINICVGLFALTKHIDYCLYRHG